MAKGLVVNPWTASDDLLTVTGGTMVPIWSLLGRCVLITGSVLLIC